MSLSIHQVSVPVYARILTQLSHTLDKANAYAEARKFKPEILMAARLYPDMWSLAEQIRAACNHAVRGVARISGLALPEFERHDTTIAEMKERIAWALDFVHKAESSAFDAARPITFKLGGKDTTMTATEYLLAFSMPNFYFHATTAYDILRHNGVPLSKTDFIGS
jgi:hypothetical protein